MQPIGKMEKNKVYIKDVILIPSPKISTVPKGIFRENLYASGFAITGFELNTNDSDKILRSKMDTLFKDIFSLRPQNIINFEYVRAIEKGLYEVKTDGPIDGKKLYHFVGSRKQAIYIRAKSDFSHLVHEQPPSSSSTESESEPDENAKSKETKSSVEDHQCPVCAKPFPLLKDLTIHASSCGDHENLSVNEFKPPAQTRIRPPSHTLTRPPSHTLTRPPVSSTMTTPPASTMTTSSTSAMTTPSASTMTTPPTSAMTTPSTSAMTPPSVSTVSTSTSAQSVSTRLRPPTQIIPTPITFKTELKRLQNRFQQGEEKKLNLRLHNVYNDMARKFKLFFKTDITPINVSFFGESGVDDGGLMREAFCLAFATANSNVLCGMENRYTLLHDKIKLAAGDFFVFGQMISLALLMGAPGPHNLSKSFAAHIVSLKPDSIELEDIPVAEIQEKLEEIMKCQTKTELDSKMATFDERFEAG